MMALSALSLSHRNRVHNSDALEHYQKVPLTMRAHLQNPQDSYSDGALFTHFLLLLYEVWTDLSPPLPKANREIELL